jgi:poly-gamma-glutamate synthesis protein (capsule biosynthesis protein)
VAGDIMLDRYIRKQINRYDSAESFANNFLPNMKEVNSKYDYVMANLEGPITESKSKSLLDDGSYSRDLIFTFPTSSVEILKLLNIKVVSLANNHTDNFFHKGYEDTKKFLEKGNIKYFGNPYNNNLAKESLSEIVCEKEICIAYIGYHQFTENNGVEIVSEEIKRIKENNSADFVIVMPHWGVEYETTSNQKQKDLSHAWIDAGADMVIGAHPHVRQESEIYKDKHIYYSLGNYIFDQWFSSEVKTGKVLDITFTKYKNLDGVVEKSIKLDQSLEVNISKELIKYR